MLVLNPKMASNLLMYRFNRIEEAKEKSNYLGFSGALFPWESAFTGVECCPSWAPEVLFIFFVFCFIDLINFKGNL
jgi:protein-glucosylgalactosylhydroxylysine glucosidase